MANYHLSAKDIMQVEIATILADATVQDAAQIMRREGVRSLVVLPRDASDPPGIVTYTDIVYKVLAEGRSSQQTYVFEIMTKPAVTIPPTMKVKYIARLFRQVNIGHAPVIDGGRLLGIVSMTDLITEVVTESA